MSRKNSFNSMKTRYGYEKMSNWGILDKKQYPSTTADKVNVRGKDLNVYANPLVRIREDKLRSLKRALYNSYQSAIIQFEKDDREYHFRCLINHDKLKVDYEDKILSIPFREVPVELEGYPFDENNFQDTGTPGVFLDENGQPLIDEQGNVINAYRVRPGDTFKWISGNEGFMPNSYWIIFLQYSEETAYFRGQIRKADDVIEVIPIEQDGSEGEPLIYHGWSTGPNEEEAIWNVKKGVVWNDLYYSKILYITKDETTSEFFRRFDRVVINGQTWQIQGYNDNYGSSRTNSDTGMIRVALKETYTSTDEIIKDFEQQKSKIETIDGPINVQSFDTVHYYMKNGTGTWTVPSSAPVKILSNSATQLVLEIKEIKQQTSFDLIYGEESLTINVKPF